MQVPGLRILRRSWSRSRKMVLDRVFAWAQGLGAPDAGEVVAHEMAAGGDAATPAYRLLVVPALSDNYMYVVLPTAAAARGRAVAIDVADADRLAAVLARERVHALDAVLSTHYHSDHSGGNALSAGALVRGKLSCANMRAAPCVPSAARAL